MTIAEALKSVNLYPIPVNAIERICIDRGLSIATVYTKEIGVSEDFRLSLADTYEYLSVTPNIVEQAAGVNSAIAIKKMLATMANDIYAEYEDPKFNGVLYGFIGDDFNV